MTVVTAMPFSGYQCFFRSANFREMQAFLSVPRA